jgi:hypothetical protein
MHLGDFENRPEMGAAVGCWDAPPRTQLVAINNMCGSPVTIVAQSVLQGSQPVRRPAINRDTKKPKGGTARVLSQHSRATCFSYLVAPPAVCAYRASFSKHERHNALNKTVCSKLLDNLDVIFLCFIAL